MSPEGLAIIGPLAIAEMKSAGWEPDSVGGLTLGADPISYAIAYASSHSPRPIRAFTVRKTPKAHGTAKLIEGPFTPTDRVVVIEDVITTGASALKAADVIQREGGQILGVLALIDREEGGREAILRQGLAVHSIVSVAAILARMDQVDPQPS
jgi:orotate phosphoribosyltransferase